ncbi:hypothetical protein [Nocardia sp. NPDC060249]|uniref:hypothetical protein n=1 Tax=Nocardia sp. NPDC060249 TaxID=3347082 RepID=UPI00364C5B59
MTTTEQRSASRRIRSQVPVLGDYKRHKLWVARTHKGIPSKVNLDGVLAHVLWLRSIGFRDDAIAIAAGVSQRTIWNTRMQNYDTMLIEQASRIMSVTHVPVEAQNTLSVPVLGVRRRLQALQRIGYSNRHLGEHLGVTHQLVAQLPTRTHVKGATWLRVADLYEQLSSVPGPSKKAREFGARNNFPSPMAWADLDIDHPDSKPVFDAAPSGEVDEVLLQRIIDGRHDGEVRGPERKAVIDHAIERGWNRERLSQSLNISIAGADMAFVRRRRELRKQAA